MAVAKLGRRPRWLLSARFGASLVEPIRGNEVQPEQARRLPRVPTSLIPKHVKFITDLLTPHCYVEFTYK